MNWQLLGMVSGAAVLAAPTLQALAAVFLLRRRSKMAQTGTLRRRASFDRQLQTALQWARAVKPIFKAWSGAKPFRVAAMIDEAIDCKSFYLVPVDGCPLPRFEPGQYLTFQLPCGQTQQPVVRCYSLSDRPREDYFRVTVKISGPPAGKPELPPGRGSTFFNQRVEVGDTLSVQAPQGAFFLDPRDQSPVVLVGGGIGMTPIMSMASTIAQQRSGRTAYVFAGFRNSREQPFREALHELAASDANLHCDISYSRPTPADQLERDYHHRGHVDVARLREVLPSSNFHFYVCGPPPMMESLVPALLQWGVPESHVHHEAFGPASVQGLSRTTNAASLGTAACSVEFSVSAKKLSWSGEQASLLELAEISGLTLESGCRAGNCGQCVIKVLEGAFCHVKQPGLAVGENECLACVAVPQSDLVLEA